MIYKNIKQKKSSGFTLIELMIVVAIVGILASIAYPSYTQYVQKSKRTEAMVALMQAAQIQEKYYSQNLRYAKDAAQLSVSAITENRLYDIVISGKNSDGGDCSNDVGPPVDSDTYCIDYQVKATAKEGESQRQDEICRIFTITNTGAKASENSAGDDSTATCW